MNLTVEQLVELCKESEKECPIDFFDVNADEDACRYLVACNVLELYNLIPSSEEREAGLMIALCNQIIQNQFLYMKMFDMVKKLNKVELQSCPFCGHDMNQQYIDSPEDTIYPMNRERTIWNIVCQDYAGGCDAVVIGDSKEDCIEKWNKRK